jgi:hypothetical protein
LIANSRLITINSFKENGETNDNIQKTYKKITCEPCNNELGKYEELKWSNLSYATVWKVLAGNVNCAFDRSPEYLLNNTDKLTIESFEEQMFDIIKTKKIIPENTFKFDFNPMKSDLTNKFGVAVKSVKINPVDESGKPIEGVKIFVKDKGGGSKEKGYTASSDKNGNAELNILTRVELVRILKEELTITNSKTKETKDIKIDFLVYISFNSNNHRLVFLLPLIGKINTGWVNSDIEIKHRGFLKILQDNFEELSILELTKYFE